MTEYARARGMMGAEGSVADLGVKSLTTIPPVEISDGPYKRIGGSERLRLGKRLATQADAASSFFSSSQ